MLARLVAAVSLRSRRRKFELFMRTIRPDERTTVVDVGVTDSGFGELAGHGYTHNFFEALYPWPERITAVGATELPRFRSAFPRVRCIVADGRDLPFAEGEFDVAFSNAVLEHVGSREDQRAFVGELCRVAGRVFLTTPSRRFPIDLHTLVPFVHWLPRRLREAVFRVLGRKEGLGVELLTPRSLRELFPRPAVIVARGHTLVAISPPPEAVEGGHSQAVQREAQPSAAPARGGEGSR